MCHYTQVGYSCGHCRYTVLEWCESYETTHRRCPLHVVAIEKRAREICSSCAPSQEPEWMSYFKLKVDNAMDDKVRRTREMYARQSRQTLASTIGMQCMRPQPVQRERGGNSWGCVRI